MTSTMSCIFLLGLRATGAMGASHAGQAAFGWPTTQSLQKQWPHRVTTGSANSSPLPRKSGMQWLPISLDRDDSTLKKNTSKRVVE